VKSARHLLLLALLVALAFQPALAGIAMACAAPSHHGHDRAAIASHAHADASGSNHRMSADVHAATPIRDDNGGHPAGCAGCGEAGSHCCSSLFLIPASVAPTRAPPGAREIRVDDTHAIASRPFDGPFRPPRTIPL
jgi:hypothetical protein